MTTHPPRLEEVLSSTGRIRVLTLLSQVEELHLTEIAKRTEQSYMATQRHLQALEDAGIVEERRYGRIRIFKINRSNSKARILQNLVLEWNHNLEEVAGSTLNREPS